MTERSSAPAEAPKRTRRAEPISKRVSKSGATSYEFRVDVGVKADGSRDRRRFTCKTYAEARREFRRITTEVSRGVYVREATITVEQACEAWLAGRRGIRAGSASTYRDALKPVRARLGGKQLQQLTKADGDQLVEWMLSQGRRDVRHYQPESLSGRICALLHEHPGGVSAADIAAAFPGHDVYTCLASLLRAGRVIRPRRGFYIAWCEISPQDGQPAGVKPVTVRATLTAFTAVIQSYVDQGVLERNVIALVQRPSDHFGHDHDTAKSWTTSEVEQFANLVRHDRLYACWLLSCYGLRRSELLGLRWDAVDLDSGVLSIRRGRVAVGATTVEGLPKSRRSRRDLPLPDELVAALRALKITCKQEALALGAQWCGDRLVAVHKDTTPVRPEWYSDEFHRLRERAGLRRIRLHGLRNTSVSLMLDQHHPVHIVAQWHGHDPAMSLSIYAHAKTAELRAAATALFGSRA